MYRDRTDAGRRLAAALNRFKDSHPVVLALPRGGVPVAVEIADALGAPLDVVIVRKIGAPGFEELAIGAVAEGTPLATVIDRETVAELRVPARYLDEEVDRQKHEIERRQQAYRGTRAPLPLNGRTAIVVDDGIATGATMRAALRSVRRRGPARVIMAVPVASPTALATLRAEADELVCLAAPPRLDAISLHYAEFHQLRDREVTELLDRAAQRPRREGESPRL